MRFTPISASADMFGLHCIVALSKSRAHHPPAIVVENVVGEDVIHGVPVARREARLEAHIRLACCVFQLRRWAAELFELRERGVDVRLVEEFGAPDEATFDCHEFGDSPLCVEPVLRGPFNHLDEDRSEVVQLVHSLDV